MSARPLAPALVAALLSLSPPLAARDDEAAPPEAHSAASEPVAATTDAAKSETPAAEAAPAPAPQLVVVDAVRDLGKIQRGERAEVEFTLENRGEGPLKIKSAQPACGCTVASFDAEIAPGGSGHVRAWLDSSTLAGAVAKSITVVSNDPASPRAVLTIKAEIVTFVTVSPAFARVLQVRSQPAAPTVVQLWSGDGTPVEVLAVQAPEPWIVAYARRAAPGELRAEGPADQWRIEVELLPDAPLGPLADKLVVRTSHPRQSEVEIPLSGFVRAVLTPAPAIADFGSLGRNVLDKSRFVLKLFNFGSEPIEIQRAAIDVPFVTVATAAEDPGRRFRVELRLAPDAPKGKFEGTLRLETTSPSMPVVEVPVRGKIG
ncbi:MAG TPA: DUF1573 domain-containing protein [Thermoanaerobaculia bacterium]